MRVRGHAGRVLLVVEDSGRGMPQEELQRLGQRFFRAEGSEAPGSGLGWSIVQRIAAAHGAALQARNSPRLGGLCVQVSFPGAPGPAMRK